MVFWNKAKANTNVLNIYIPNSQVQNSNEIINKAFTIDEINKHINSLKNNKSPGIDNIILDTGIIPNYWTIEVIRPLYKHKCYINDVNNYRGITLFSCISKFFTSVLTR